MKKYVLAIDQGTTSTRAILIDKDGRPVNMAQRPVNCIFPQSGWVETDAMEILVSVIDVINEVLLKQNISISEVDSIGITNQRETTVIWDKTTGQPVANAIVWQSRQSAAICDALEDKKEYIHKKTGLLINPYFSASKIRFILDHIPNGQKRAEKGELMFGTIDCWLLYKLTKGKVHATDVSNASRTLLFNINSMKWDDDLCALFNIPKIMLPKVCPSSYDFGAVTYFSKDVHICGIAGDQQAALFGQTCFSKGESKNTYGTGCFMLMNTGNKVVLSKLGLISTVAWQIGDKVTYALEGSVFIGGALVQWLKSQMHLIETEDDSEYRAVRAGDTNGIYIVPAFVGLGAPYWDDDARGAVFGLTRQSTQDQFVRASLEAIAYQCKDVFEVMKKESCCNLTSLKVDGGATANKYLLQFQSDLLDTQIMLPFSLQTTALGVAYLAGLSSGFYKDLEELRRIHTYQAIFTPKTNRKVMDELYEGWKKAVQATMAFKYK